MTAWDEMAVNHLCDGAAAGLTASQIARALRDHGYPFSRGAVVGKLERLDIRLGLKTAWCDEAIEILRRTAALGAQAVQTELCERGYHFERKQITDKAHRLGITIPRSKPSSLSPDDSAAVPLRAIKQRTKHADIATPEAWANRPDDAPLPDSAPVKLIDLRFHHCRWPLGRDAEGHRLFCGAHKISESYCQHHFNLSLKETTHGTQEIKQVA